MTERLLRLLIFVSFLLVIRETRNQNKEKDMKRLRVWGGSADGRHRMIVATTTKKAAMEALGVSAYTFRNFFSETANETELATARPEPGVVFEVLLSGREEYRRKET